MPGWYWREAIAEAARRYYEALDAACALALAKGDAWGVRVSGDGLSWTFEVTREVEGRTIAHQLEPDRVPDR